jgi:VCBS repeat protein/immunoglobulin I-set domain protein
MDSRLRGNDGGWGDEFYKLMSQLECGERLVWRRRCGMWNWKGLIYVILIAGCAVQAHAQQESSLGLYGERERLFQNNFGQFLLTRLSDVDGDGDLDVVTVNYGFIGVFLNDGDGVFSARAISSEILTQQNGGIYPQNDFLLGNLNNDSFPDVILVSGNKAVAPVAMGLGDGTFGEIFFLSLQTGATSVAGGDLNGDGFEDVLFGHGFDGRIASVFLGDGVGGLTEHAPILDPEAIGYVKELQLADITGDRKLDLIVNRFRSVEIYVGADDGTFRSAPAILEVDSNSGVFWDIEAGDLDGDGTDDVVLTTSRGSAFQAIFFGPDGSLTADARIPLPDTIDSNRRPVVTLLDVTLDGSLDVVVAGTSCLGPAVITGDWRAGRVSIVETLLAGRGGVAELLGGDLDSDMKPDLVVVEGENTGFISSSSSVWLLFHRAVTPLMLEQPETVIFVEENVYPEQFSARAGGIGEIGYQWRKDGEPLEEGGLFDGVRTDTLTIRRAELEAEGEYDVVVRDETGKTVSGVGVLAVRSVPSLLGDVNGDGVVDAKDVRIVVESFTKKKKHDRERDGEKKERKKRGAK